MLILIECYLEQVFRKRKEVQTNEWYCTMFEYAFRVADDRLELARGGNLRTNVIIEQIKKDESFLRVFDFNKMQDYDLASLLIYDYDIFSKYIDVSKLAIEIQVDLFLSNPARYNAVLTKKLEKGYLEVIAAVRPSSFIEYNLPVSRLSPSMLLRVFDSIPDIETKYAKLTEVTNATQYRTVLLEYQDLIPLLTLEEMGRSPLTNKQWLLLKAKFNENIDYKPGTHSALTDLFSLDVLIGKSKTSQRTKTVTAVSNDS